LMGAASRARLGTPLDPSTLTCIKVSAAQR
jgi:hypothetical protein